MNARSTEASIAVMRGAGWRVVGAAACTAHENLREPIKGVISGGIGMLFGDSNTGKTLVAVDWAFHLATGTPWAGRSTDRLPVVYFATEACVSVERRIVAILKQRGSAIPTDKLFVVDVQPNLANKSEVDTIIAALKAMAPAGVVFFDTLANVSNGADENSVGEMSHILRSAGRMHRETGWHVVFIHHTNKSGSMRGSSSIRGRLDFVIELKVAASGAIEVSADKLRDDKKGHIATMVISTIDVGSDGYGEPIVAPVAQVAHGTTASQPPVSTTITKRARRVQTLFELARDLLDKARTPFVEDTVLRAAFFATIGNEVSSDSRRRTYARVIAEALKSGVLLGDGTKWHLPGHNAGQRDGTASTSNVPAVLSGATPGQTGQDGAPLGARPCPDVPGPSTEVSTPTEEPIEFDLTNLRLDDVLPPTAWH